MQIKLRCLSLFLIAAQFLYSNDPTAEEELKVCPFSAKAAEGTEWLIAQGEEHPVLKWYTNMSAHVMSIYGYIIAIDSLRGLPF